MKITYLDEKNTVILGYTTPNGDIKTTDEMSLEEAAFCAIQLFQIAAENEKLYNTMIDQIDHRINGGNAQWIVTLFHKVSNHYASIN